MRWSCSPWWAKATGVRVAAVGRGTRDPPREQLPKGENGAGSPSCLTCSSVMHLRRVRRPPRPRYSRERWRHTRRQLGVDADVHCSHLFPTPPFFFHDASPPSPAQLAATSAVEPPGSALSRRRSRISSLRCVLFPSSPPHHELEQRRYVDSSCDAGSNLEQCRRIRVARAHEVRSRSGPVKALGRVILEKYKKKDVTGRYVGVQDPNLAGELFSLPPLKTSRTFLLAQLPRVREYGTLRTSQKASNEITTDEARSTRSAGTFRRTSREAWWIGETAQLLRGEKAE